MENSNKITTLVIFAHGKESGPRGSKIKHLAAIADRLGATVMSPDYSDLADPDARVQRLCGLTRPVSDRTVLVGSSMGGYVSCVAAEQQLVDGIFLMAPAIGIAGYAVQNPTPNTQHLCIVMGWNDEIIPVNNVIAFAHSKRAALHMLNGDHRLDSALPEVGDLFEQFLRKVMA